MKASTVLSRLVLVLAFVIAIAIMVVAVVGCDAEGPSTQHAQVGSIAFDMPADWQRSDTTRRGIQTSIWTPDDNDHKESVTVTRTELGLQVGVEHLTQFLHDAQRSLRGTTPASITPFVTPRGLVGARLELDYIPPERHEPYHRVHAVLIDGPVLVHVLYTALVPDTELGALHTVLSSIHEVRP